MFAFEMASASDVDAAYERVVADGVEAVSPPTWAEIGSFGRIRGVTLRDPDGFLVELYAPEGDRA
jgi:catechol 2,3-dioxygenase-like lactoylglutathione lyase family enzyme